MLARHEDDDTLQILPRSSHAAQHSRIHADSISGGHVGGWSCAGKPHNVMASNPTPSTVRTHVFFSWPAMLDGVTRAW